MRIVIQRVLQAMLEIDGKVYSQIANGLLVLVGVEDTDTAEDIEWLCGKAVRMRIFNDPQGVMNESVLDRSGEVMVVSQFTLHASTKKGNRPSYSKASKPDTAIPLYEQFVLQMEKELGRQVATGVFGADMKITLSNDGPVTVVMDSKNRE